MNIRHRLGYWKYRRRARKLRDLTLMLGYDFAIEYGRRRNWIHSHDGRNIFLAGPGREIGT